MNSNSIEVPTVFYTIFAIYIVFLIGRKLVKAVKGGCGQNVFIGENSNLTQKDIKDFEDFKRYRAFKYQIDLFKTVMLVLVSGYVAISLVNSSDDMYQMTKKCQQAISNASHQSQLYIKSKQAKDISEDINANSALEKHDKYKKQITIN
ncbi:hypothetical protein EHJ37_25265 [Vibrio parahaemolyticus]|nr:hypothetical protein [Vibrio parahaemolyticus]